ncbi:MAG: hypothetical protein ACP5I7_00205 [Sulfolobales archaeon]|jgi:translin
MMKPRITEEYKKELIEILRKKMSELDKRDLARERIIKISRDLVRCSGKVVSNILVNNVDDAKKELRICNDLLKDLMKHYSEAPDLVRGIASQALTEYCEAAFLLKMYTEDVDEYSTQIPPESIVLGILDLTGEMRRIAIKLLGEWDLDTAREIIDLMKTIYLTLSPQDYPDAIAPGFRHKIDVLRRNIEDLETLYTDIKTRRELIRELERKE